MPVRAWRIHVQVVAAAAAAAVVVVVVNLATRRDQSTLKSSHPRTSEGPWHPPNSGAYEGV